MPNLVHAIIVINDPVGATRHSPIDTQSGYYPARVIAMGGSVQFVPALIFSNSSL